MFEQFFILFSLIGLGVLAGRFGGIDSTRNEGIGKLLLQVATPALLFTSTLSLDIREKVLIEFLIMLALCFGWYVMFAAMAAAYTRICRKTVRFRNMVIVSMFTSNNGFMGFPIAIAFFGEKGLLFMVAHNLMMNIILFSIGIYLLHDSGSETEDKKPRKPRDIVKQMMNPNITAVFLGLGLSIIGGTSWIPGPVMTLLELLAALAIPLSMMYIGITLSGSHLSVLINDKMVVQASLVRLTIFPIITLGICVLLPIPSSMSQILFLTAMLPTAATVPVLTGIYSKTGKEEATRIALFSTVISLVTAPLGVLIATSIL